MTREEDPLHIDMKRNTDLLHLEKEKEDLEAGLDIDQDHLPGQGLGQDQDHLLTEEGYHQVAIILTIHTPGFDFE